MKFIKQIGFEIRNILKSKFLLIIGILVMAASIAVPVIGKIAASSANAGDPGVRPMPGVYYAKEAAISAYGGGNGQDPITVNGVTITAENPFYWNVQSLMQQKDQLQINKAQYTTPQAMDLASDLFDAQIDYFAKVSQYITDQQDYRINLAFMSNDSLVDKFIYEHGDVDADVLMNAVSMQKGMDSAAFKKKYIDITPSERQAAFVKVDEMLNQTFSVIENNDFPQFIALSIQQQNDQIKNLNDNIAIQQQMIIDNPSQEDIINQTINDLRKQIDMIKTSAIPVLQYRLDKNIVPGLNIWQNAALDDVTNNKNQLAYTTLLSEDDFMKDMGLVQQYKTYQKYKSFTQNQINQLNNTILIAQRSLDDGKPDMKYVASGSRSKTVSFLDYSAIIAVFGVLLGGWIIASEFQQGTIRLLMIRPKTRVKILMSKFIGAFAVCLAMYLAGSLLNILANGICFGFSDYAYPNYSITGPTSFFIYYLPKLLICIIPILFGFSVAFLLSTVTKNIAVSIAVPIVLFVCCFIGMNLFAYRSAMGWIAWTPIPFVQISSFFIQYSPVWNAMQNGNVISLPYGIGLLTLLTAVCMAVSIVVFKKKDIAN